MTFGTFVKPVHIVPHPNADALEIAEIGAYRCIVRKGEIQDGQLVAYIREGSIVPVELQERLGVVGRLAGSDKNRVKAIRLRQVLSQGLVLPAEPGWVVDQDVSDVLGISKYEPPIPTCLVGDVANVGPRYTAAYDIENWKMHPRLPEEVGGEWVFTEKIHGTCFQAVLLPAGLECEGRRFWVGSKGLGARGLLFRDSPNNAKVAYIRAAALFDLEHRMMDRYGASKVPVILMGEVFGAGIQDLRYNTNLGFRAFDLVTGFRGEQAFWNSDDLDAELLAMGLDRVPILHKGPYSRELLETLVSGPETVSGNGVHVREGVVIRPTREVSHPTLPNGRVQLKHISEAYLFRGGSVTDHN